MRKFLLTISAVLCLSSTYSQVKFGIKAGLSGPNVTFTNSGNTATASYAQINSFHAVLFGEIPLTDKFAVQPGLSVIGKGFAAYDAAGFQTTNGQTQLVAQTVTANPLYLELPIQMITRLAVRNCFITFSAGPYVGYGLTGKYNLESTYYDANNGAYLGDKAEKFDYFADTEFKRLDAGAIGTIGYVFRKGILINLAYEQGLTNISNDKDVKATNKTTLLSVGYLF